VTVGLFYLNWTWSEVLSAWANLLRNDREGVVFALSTREITDCFVFNFSASCFWVSPFSMRARITARAISYSSRDSSYAFLNLGFFINCFL